MRSLVDALKLINIYDIKEEIKERQKIIKESDDKNQILILDEEISQLLALILLLKGS